MNIDRAFLRQWGLRIWATFASLVLFVQFVGRPQLDGLAQGALGSMLLDLLTRALIAAVIALPIAAIVTLVAAVIASRNR